MMKTPLGIVLPLGLLYAASIGTRKTEVSEDFVDFGLTP